MASSRTQALPFASAWPCSLTGSLLPLPVTRPLKGFTDRRRVEAHQTKPPPDHPCPLCPADVPIESLRLRFALLQSLNTTLETFFLPLVELRQTPMYTHSIAALLKEAKGQCPAASNLSAPPPPKKRLHSAKGTASG